MRYLAVLLALLLLPACSSMPLASMWQLRNADPLTTDPAEVRLAVRLPAIYDLPPGTVKMTLSLDRASTGEKVAETFLLESTDEVTSPFLLGQRKDGYDITIYWIAEDDYARLRNWQRTARRWKEETPGETKGSLSISTKPCLAEGTAMKKVLVSSYILMDGQEDFVTLNKDVDVVKTLDMSGLPDTLEACTA